MLVRSLRLLVPALQFLHAELVAMYGADEALVSQSRDALGFGFRVGVPSLRLDVINPTRMQVRLVSVVGVPPP